MLTIEYLGAQLLLDILKQVRQGQILSEADISPVLDHNAFFVNYYCQWNGITRQNLASTILSFSRPDWQAPNSVLANLGRGFHTALDQLSNLQANLDALKALDASDITAGVAQHLPADTPLDAVVHYTVDGFNGGFQYQDDIGLSILIFNNPETLAPIIAHELHHVGFGYWSKRDTTRQVVMGETSGRAVAVRHVQNLLMEGMATFFCSPLQIDQENMDAALVAKLERFQRDDQLLLAQAGKILADAITPGADFEDCQRAYDEIAIDLDGIQPVGHYIGARMVEIISQIHPLCCTTKLPIKLAWYRGRRSASSVLDKYGGSHHVPIELAYHLI
jgi:hypothetical protein